MPPKISAWYCWRLGCSSVQPMWVWRNSQLHSIVLWMRNCSNLLLWICCMSCLAQRLGSSEGDPWTATSSGRLLMGHSLPYFPFSENSPHKTIVANRAEQSWRGGGHTRYEHVWNNRAKFEWKRPEENTGWTHAERVEREGGCSHVWVLNCLSTLSNINQPHKAMAGCRLVEGNPPQLSTA